MGDSRSLAAVRPPPLWLGRHGKGPTTPAARKGVPRPGGEGPELRSQIPLRGTGECVGQACRRAADFLRGAPGGGYAKRGRGSRSFLERQKKKRRRRKKNLQRKKKKGGTRPPGRGTGKHYATAIMSSGAALFIKLR